jgi:CO/xanthine dehydrogenase Mo-binding subunit
MPDIKKTALQKHKKNNKPSGSREFYSDCSRENMLYAALVRSPAASGTITKISVPELPDGYFLFTAHDIPGKNAIVTAETETPVFCGEEVKYLGEPLGIVAGPDEKKVYALISEIEIVFDQSTLESALQTVAEGYTGPDIPFPKTKNSNEINQIERAMNINPNPVIQEQTTAADIPVPTHPLFERQLIAERTIKSGIFAGTDKKKEPADKENIFTSADFDIAGTWEEKNTQAYWLETNGAFCFMDDGILNVYTPTQWPVYLQKSLASVLGIKEGSILIKKTNSSPQNTNGIWRNTTLTAETAVAAFLTGKPVRLVLSREEQKNFMAPGVSAIIHHRSAVTKEGHITAMDITIDIDVGAWNPFASEILDRLVIASCNIYNPESVFITAKAYASQNPPSSMYTHLLDSQSFFAIESLMQQIADTLHLLPTEIRLKNICTDNRTSSMPFLFKTGNTAEIFNTLLSISDFNRKYTAFNLDSLHRKESGTELLSIPLRGIGFASAFDGSGYLSTDLFSSNQKMEITLETDDIVSIHALTPSDSIADIWITTAASILSVSKSNIRITPEFTETNVPPLPENIYNNVSIMTQLLKHCCLDLKKKRDKNTPRPITSRRGIAASMKKQWNKKEFSGYPFHTTSFGSSVVEVEIDPYTFIGRIKGIWSLIDCGEILSEHAAETTIRLAIQKELSDLVIDEIIPCDAMSISFVHSSANPGQIGDIIHSTVPAAFRAALSQALSRQLKQIPCSFEDLSAQTIAEETEEK